MPTAELKLFFAGFKEIYFEFEVLHEMTVAVLAEKGIFLKFIQSNRPVRAKIDEEMEQEVQMEDEGQYLTKSSHIFSGTDSMNGSIII